MVWRRSRSYWFIDVYRWWLSVVVEVLLPHPYHYQRKSHHCPHTINIQNTIHYNTQNITQSNTTAYPILLKLSIQHWPSHSQPKLNRSHVEMEGKGSTEANTISVKTTISKVCRHMTSIFWEIWFKAFSKQLLITKECTTTKLVPHHASNSTFYILCSHWCLITF